jgi:hypothetical protein
MTIGDQAGQHIDNEIDRRTMARMLDLRDILELVKDGLNQDTFSQKEFVRQGHQAVLHILAQLGNQLDLEILPELFEEGPRNVTSVPKQLTKEPFRQDWDRNSIIDIPGCELTSQQLALVIDHQVQFEAVKPSHGGLASGGDAFKYLVLLDAPIVTHG